jgi:hypothetical protein
MDKGIGMPTLITALHLRLDWRNVQHLRHGLLAWGARSGLRGGWRLNEDPPRRQRPLGFATGHVFKNYGTGGKRGEGGAGGALLS